MGVVRWRNRVWRLAVVWLMLGMLALQGMAQGVPIFRVGVLGNASSGIVQGAQLAVDQINEAGGVTGADGTVFELELVAQSIDDMATSVANINQASVIAVIGPPRSSDVLGNRELLATLNVPLLTPATDDSILVNDQTGQLIRIRAAEAIQGRDLAEYLVDDVGATFLATVQLDVESTVSVIGFNRAATQLGLPPTQEFLLSGSTTIESITADVVAAQTDVVAAYGPPEATATLYAALRQAGWIGRFAYNRANEAAFVETVPVDSLEGILGVTTWTYTLTDAANDQFVLDYVRDFGVVPDAIAAAAFDAVQVLERAIAQPNSLLNNVLSLEAYEGLQGMLDPSILTAGELSNNVVITELNAAGVPDVVARFAGSTRLELEAEDDVQTVFVTPTPQATATPDGVVLTITRAVQNVRTGPGLDYDIIGQLREGQQAQVIGANVNFSWVVIEFRGQRGWLSREILDVFGDLNTLPIFNPPPTPTALPSPTVTPTPSAQPLADIVITAASPNRLTIGQPFSITVTVRNQGIMPAGAFAIAASYEPGSVYTAVNLPGLDANTQTNITLEGVLSNGATGAYPVTIVADLNQQVNEGAGEANNSAFIHNIISDAPLLNAGTPTGTLTLTDGATTSLDNGSQDVQWSAGGLVPLGAAEIGLLAGVSSFDAVHRDLILNATLVNAPIVTVVPGQLIGIRTSDESKLAVIEVTSATNGGNITFNFRVYE